MADNCWLKKLVSISLLMQHFLISYPHYGSAQQDITQLIYGFCSPSTFSMDSAFSVNLNIALNSLFNNAASSLYSSTSSVSNTSSSTDNVYAMYQCRGDLSLPSCYTCVTALSATTNRCASAMGARIQLLGCFLRYESVDFLGTAESTLVSQNCSSSINPDTTFQSNLASVLNATATAAPSHGGFYAASQVSPYSGDSVYALAQCMGYITPSQCAACISNVSRYNTVCPNAIAGQVYYVSCYYLYSNSPVVFNTAGSPPPLPGDTGSPTAPPRNTGSPTSLREGGSKLPVVVGTVLGVILLGAVGAFFLFRRCKQTTSKTSRTAGGFSGLEHIVATRFSLDELRQATENFHPRYKLGDGGFGPVYKGRLRNNKEVAIKMLSSRSHQGDEQFLNEVTLLTNVQHRNLVELLGCCVEDSERLLVYEYLPNRSLDLHLFENVSQQAILGWQTRMEIIVGIARGLAYLHEDSYVKVVHRDIKTANILLDNNLHPKIGDFGLARFFADDVTHLTTRVAGTLGYLAPEYAINGQLTEKADVYSFGLVTLEIVSGRRIIDQQLPKEEEQLLAWTWALYQRKQQLQLVDPKLGNAQVNTIDVVRVVHVALLCAQTWPGSRPTMSQAFAMLCGQSEILALPTKPTIINMDPNQVLVEAKATCFSSSLDASYLLASDSIS